MSEEKGNQGKSQSGSSDEQKQRDIANKSGKPAGGAGNDRKSEQEGNAPTGKTGNNTGNKGSNTGNTSKSEKAGEELEIEENDSESATGEEEEGNNEDTKKGEDTGR
jgi:hypothetical protein